MKKWILRGVLALVVLFVVLALGLYFMRNSLVRAGVIRGGKYATDQDTSLTLADLSLGGSLNLSGLDIDNIKDKVYSAPKILQMKSCGVVVQTSSLLTHKVMVDNITIEGLELTLEQNDLRNNLNDLLAVIRGKSPAAGDTQKKSPGKELSIGVVSLKGTKVHLRGKLFGQVLNQDLNLPDLEIKEPTNPDGRPMKIADLIGQIVIHLAKEVLENPQIPGDIKNKMKDAQAILANVGGELEKHMKELPNLKNLNLPTSMPGIKVPDAGKDIGKGLNDLLNKKN